MRITEVRIKLVTGKGDRLKAFCSMTLDDEFVVRDIKVIEGEDGYFVAMPSRKMSDHCPKCGYKNHLRARFCNQCGAALPEGRVRKSPEGRTKLHADIAHPINIQCRKAIQQEIVAAFQDELRRSTLPGYEAPSWDEPDDEIPETVS
ncbi:MAG: SpoVG family protein [Sedimentisphaerales bacterium]|nr:SpoVG family protein [Sedimentisphaerales bacterium]